MCSVGKSPHMDMSVCIPLITYPPLAMTVCVPIITLFTLDIMANTAESFIIVVSISCFAKLIASSCPC